MTNGTMGTPETAGSGSGGSATGGSGSGGSGPQGTGAQTAVTVATRLNEIRFPEFTAKLITDTFDALVSANIRQTEAYIELVTKITKTLTEFINETKDDISGQEILQYLSVIAKDPAQKSGTFVEKGATLSTERAGILNDKVKISGVVDSPGIQAGDLDDAAYNKILEAVAKRIAADKYTILREMVKMGVLRLVVEHGIIETKLTFTTYGSTFYQTESANYDRQDYNVQSRNRSGGFWGLWGNTAKSTVTSTMTVSTAQTTDRDTTGSMVQIFGHVEIQFKTDYQPMAG
jgi:hypothetical protein